MAKTKLFIGSSKANVGVARIVANRLESDGSTEATVWDEGIFGLSQGLLEKLLTILNEFDFAVLIWAPDDITESKGEARASPRDNVVFECGLFMGAIGRERVFIICDQSASVKIPSDLLGITLASYDGERVGRDDEEAAVRMACDLIKREIQRPRFPTIVGQWKSRYVLAGEPGQPVVIDDVEIKAARGGISITNTNNPAGDYYAGHGRIVRERQIVGEWSSRLSNSGAQGVFLLTVNTRGTIIHGYCTALDEHGATVYVPWILARDNGVDSGTTRERLETAEQSLASLTLRLPPSRDLSKTEQKRNVYGEWLSAVRPVHYDTPKWHVQKIRAEPSELGLKFQTTKDCPEKLQWEWTPRLEYNTFLVGPWKSLRPGSDSHGYMSVQLSSNGLYMFGHDYGAVSKHENSNLGILLFGRTKNDLESAWNAMSKGFRSILPLSETIDFSAPPTVL